MNKLRLIALIVLLAASCSTSQKKLTYSWSRQLIDGSITGVTTPFADSSEKALGVINADGSYVSPSQVTFPASSIVASTAKILIDAQDVMKEQKQSVGTCPGGLRKSGKDTPLGYWSADAMQYSAEKFYGVKIDAVFLNRGGIRVDMPDGNVMLEDITSMFPFENDIIIYKMTGEALLGQIRKSGLIQPVGGVCIVLKDGKVVDALLSSTGKPIDPKAEYTVLGNSFIDNGGDDFFLGNICTSKEIHPEHRLFDLVIEYVRDCTAAGRPLTLDKKVRVIEK